MVRDSLHVDYILRTKFIDRHVQTIHAQCHFVELIDRTEVPILRSSLKWDLNNKKSIEEQNREDIALENTASNNIRIVKPIRLPPKSQNKLQLQQSDVEQS